MTSQAETSNAANKLWDISKSECSQTMKFGSLIQYIRNIFLQKSCRKWGWETRSRLLFVFWKILIWSKSKWLAFASICFGIPRPGRTIETNFRLLIQRYVQFCFFKKRSRTSFWATFCACLFKENISHVLIYINWPNIIVLLPQLLENLAIYVLWLFIIQFVTLCDVCDVFFVHDQKFKSNVEISQEQKELLRRNKYFLSFLKDFFLPEIVSDARVGL